MKKIGVVLSGCGVYDGSEIHEAVITLLAIARSGAQAICYAPDKAQTDVINHLTGEAQAESRNVLVEAARIARGEIQPLAGPSGCAGCADRARRFWRGKEPQQLCFAGANVKSIAISRRWRWRCIRRVNRWALSVSLRHCCRKYLLFRYA
jgi:hypothetical protein